MTEIVRALLRADGTHIELEGPLSIREIVALIDAEAVDTVRLSDGIHVMVVDDAGHAKELPVNTAATYLYWDKCGGPVEHVMVGDVVVVPDADFAEVCP
jgi:hypothetical protein